MGSAGRDVNLAWEVMGIDGVFRTGSILPECSCCLFSYPQFEIACWSATEYGILCTRYDCSQHIPHQTPIYLSTPYSLDLPTIHKSNTYGISKNSRPSQQQPTRSSASSRKKLKSECCGPWNKPGRPTSLWENKSRSWQTSSENSLCWSNSTYVHSAKYSVRSTILLCILILWRFEWRYSLSLL